MNMQSAARALGGVVSNGGILAPGPGHSRHDRSLSVRFDNHAPDGFVVHSFAGDDFADCRDLVKAALGISHSDYTPPSRTEPVAARSSENLLYAAAIWKSALPIIGTKAEAYLSGRGLDPDVFLHVEALRFASACPFKGDTVPAMIAAMENIEPGVLQGVHRTRLAPKDKAMLGAAKGAVVKLSRDDEVTGGLHICEGIETGLALLCEGIAPVWACMSAPGIADFPVLSGIESLTIYADNDTNKSGQNAARACADRWHKAGREVRAFVAPVEGTDFLDWRGAA